MSREAFRTYWLKYSFHWLAHVNIVIYEKCCLLFNLAIRNRNICIYHANALRAREKDTISQTPFSNAFSWMNLRGFWLWFYWSLFLGWLSIMILLKFVPRVPIDNILALVPKMDWHRWDDKPLSELIIFILLTHICINQPQWVTLYLICPTLGSA